MNASSPFQALIFDLGGVVVRHDNGALFERLASRCAAGSGPREIAGLFGQSRWGTGTPIRYLHRHLQAQGGYGAEWPTFVADWCSHLAIDPAMLALLRELSRHNRVLLFSNTNQEHWDYLNEASGGELGRYEAYLSHRLGHEKPSRRAYELVADQAGLDPARAIFFDDLLANVEGARQAGFQAEVFRGEAWLRAFLDEKGVGLG